MGYKKQAKIFASDLETVVLENTKEQKATEAWSSATGELFKDDIHVFGDIESTLKWYASKANYIIANYHNLKFDGAFWVDWGLKHGFKLGYNTLLPISNEAYPKVCRLGTSEFYRAYSKVPTDTPLLCVKDGDDFAGIEFKEKFDLSNHEMCCVISDKGQWYSVCFNYYGSLIELRDSLKLLPFSLRKIGKDFKTKHQKLEMEYTGDRYANCPITKEEMEYIKNDIYVLKESLEIMYSEGHDKMTIGSCCMEEYKAIIGTDKWEKWYPNLTNIPLDDSFGQPNADEYIRKSFRGGWCYQVKGKEGLHYNGITVDVNSLYPSCMHSQSGNRYPIGLPTFWKGAIPEEAKAEDKYYFVRIRCRFKIKEGYLPWIQIKGLSVFYDGTECLTDSDFKYYDKATHTFKKARFIGNVEARPTLTLTCKDYELFHEHYEVIEEEVLDGCYFNTEIGIFDDYINKYAEIKKNSKGARRVISKLFLNNLFGKFSTSPDSSYKIPYIKEDGSLGFQTIFERNKETVFIAVGSAITSAAKNFTIRTAQKNFHGVDKPGFTYGDTDSLHCSANSPDEKFSADMLIDVPIHPTNFNCWKVESSWDVAQFVRQKTYIEHVTHEDLQPVDKPYYNVKCAGLPDKCKKLFVHSLEGTTPTEEEISENNYTKEHLEWIKTKRTLEDFNIGLTVPAKLKPKRISGGIVLVEEEYTMH